MKNLNPQIVFCVHHFNEGELSRKCLTYFREIFPNNQLYLIAEGEHELAKELAKEFTAQLHLCDRIKTQKTGCWTHRYLSIFLTSYTHNLLCKFDPDTVFWRQFKFDELSAEQYAADIFGTLSSAGNFIRGGCVLFHRPTVKHILSSGLLQCNYYDPQYSYESNGEIISCQDQILGYVAENLGLSLSDWRDIYIQFNGQVPTEYFKQFAATHPHKNPQDPLIQRWKTIL